MTNLLSEIYSATFSAPSVAWQKDAWLEDERALACEISCNSMNLKAHQLRIILHSKKSRLYLFAAFVDLFLALGNKGYELRKSLLEEHGGSLAQDQLTFLQGNLKKGLKIGEKLPDAYGARLATGISGSCNYIKRKFSDSYFDMQDEDYARLHWQEGDYNEACTLMEAAVLKKPNNTALRHELLSIYQESRDIRRFNSMQTKLTAKLAEIGEKLPIAWQRLV